ncbi:MAG: NADH-quinone oxidoreductase subunit N [Planctomycetota bacterium]|nr:NADH-quinone oxidoreductase subunit N [Planctomycetota bacterium]
MDWSPIYPAALLTLGILGVLITDLVTKGRRPGVAIGMAFAVLAGAGVWALGLKTSGDVVLGVLVVDKFAVVFTVFCCVTGAITVLATTRGEAFRRPGGEFLALVLAAVLGMSVLSMSVDLIVLYLAFETISVPSYVLVAMRRADAKSNEAGLKYVLFGGVSSAVMLYGLSLLVGLIGGTSFEALALAVQTPMVQQPVFIVACVMIFAGFAFKISAVPFHFWAPDVYAGAPASVAGFLAVASKAAGFAALVRVVGVTVTAIPQGLADPLGAFWPGGNVWFPILAIAAVLTMTVGNLAALKQTEIKRLLAWSSIAHAGYLLLVMCVWTEDALAAMLVYLVAYLFMNLAAFLLAGISIRELGTGELKAMRGMGRRHIGLAAAFAIVLFSLTGLPPFFGFVAKLQVFYAVFDQGFVWLGVVGLVNGVISLYYYARVVKSMYLDDAEDEAPSKSMKLALPDGLLCALLVAPLVVFGIVWWGGLLDWATTVARDLPYIMGAGR